MKAHSREFPPYFQALLGTTGLVDSSVPRRLLIVSVAALENRRLLSR